MSTDEAAMSKVCWVELMTRDAAAMDEFYGQLLGWTPRRDDIPGGGFYTMYELDGKHAAGMFELTEAMIEQGIPPNWMPYVAVADADQAVARVKELGGKVDRDPFDVMEIGRMAVITDPSGATIALWQAAGFQGTGSEFASGPVGSHIWIELLTRDVDRAGRFYAELFDWEPQLADVEEFRYTVFKTGDGVAVAGMMEIEAEMKQVPPHWAVYFHVADCRASVARAEALGAAVLVPPMELPNVGTFATLADPQNAVFALLQPAPM